MDSLSIKNREETEFFVESINAISGPKELFYKNPGFCKIRSEIELNPKKANIAIKRFLKDIINDPKKYERKEKKV